MPFRKRKLQMTARLTKIWGRLSGTEWTISVMFPAMSPESTMVNYRRRSMIIEWMSGWANELVFPKPILTTQEHSLFYEALMLIPLNSRFTKKSEWKTQLCHTNISGCWLFTCPNKSFVLQEWWQLRWKMLTSQVRTLFYLDFNTMVGTFPKPPPSIQAVSLQMDYGICILITFIP